MKLKGGKPYIVWEPIRQRGWQFKRLLEASSFARLVNEGYVEKGMMGHVVVVMKVVEVYDGNSTT